MQIVWQILFIALTIISVWLFARKIKQLRRNILLGRDEALNDNKEQRWKNVLLLAFGQKKMFRNPLVAVMHFIIYAGFIIINIEVLEIAIDGLSGTHRIFSKPLGNLYPWLINGFEFLAVGVLTVCIIFLIRRNVLHVKRLWMKELNGWPKSDANYILITEILLMSFFLTMNAADTTLQLRGYGEYAKHLTGNFAFSHFLQPLFANMSDHSLMMLERTCWWLHITGIFAFLIIFLTQSICIFCLLFQMLIMGDLNPKASLKTCPRYRKKFCMPCNLNLHQQKRKHHIKNLAQKIYSISAGRIYSMLIVVPNVEDVQQPVLQILPVRF